MKKTLITSILGLAAVGAMAQGTVNFANVGTGGLNAPIKDDVGAGLTTAGGWDVALLVQNAGNWVQIGQTSTFAAPGYFNAGTVAVSSIAFGGSGTFEVQAWSAAGGSSLAAATALALTGVHGLQGGTSASFTVSNLGGGGSPPALSANLTGLGAGFNLVALPVPEPTTIALGALGLGALLLRRRK